MISRRGKPEDKLKLIRHEQQGGRLVAMIGDGTNDAPRAGAGRRRRAMNTGTQAARRRQHGGPDSNRRSCLEII